MRTIDRIPSGRDLTPGTRLVVGTDVYERFASQPTARPELVLDVRSATGATVVAVDQDGRTHSFQTAERSYVAQIPGTGRVMWACSVPEGDHGAVLRLADAMLNCGKSGYGRGRPLLLLVARDADGAYGLPVVPASSERTRWDPGAGRGDLPGVEAGAAFVVDEKVRLAPWMLADDAPTGLHVVTDYRAAADAHAYRLESGGVRFVHDAATAEDVGRWMPARAVPGGIIHDGNPMGVGTWEDVEDAVGRALARAKDDEVLVVSVSTPGKPGETTVRHLSTSGIRLYDVDSIDDDLWDSDLEEGVWLGTDVAWYDAGEDGAEWAAEWRRATAEDLARHGVGLAEVASVATETADHRDRTVTVDEAAGWLAAAGTAADPDAQ